MLQLESTFGNHNKEFLDNWYWKLKTFSIFMMKDIVTFCEKAIENTKEEIVNSKKNLKSFFKKKEFDKIEKTIKDNEEAAKVVLEMHKFQEFNYLKHNPQNRPIANAEENTEQ